MSGGKTKSTQRTTQTLNPWSQRQWTQQKEAIDGLLGQSFQKYEGPMVAGLTGAETRAGGLINDSVGNYVPGLDEARGLVRGAQHMTPRTFGDFDANTYVNPYADDIIARSTNDINTNADRQRAQIESDMLASGAFGGSRHGVREGLLDEATSRAIGDMSAHTRFNVWDRGADRFYQDVGNDMSAQAFNSGLDLQKSGLLADFVRQQRGFEDQDINRLMGFGANQRNIEDRENAARYGEELRKYDDYWRRMQAQMGLLGSIPMLVNSSGESTEKTNPGALGVLGTLGGIPTSAFTGNPLAAFMTAGKAAGGGHGGGTFMPYMGN